MTMASVYGVVSVRVGGETLEAGGEWTYSPGGASRETVMGTRKPLGHKITPTAPFIEGVVQDRKDVSIEMFKAIQDETATLHLENGKTFVLSGAAQIGVLEINGQTGEIGLRLEGSYGEEV